MSWLFAYLSLTLVAGCTTRQSDDPVFIETVYWTNLPPPSEEDVNRQLSRSIGKTITINGARHSIDGVAAIWIPEETTIRVPDRSEWTGAPSHRSHVMVTGVLGVSNGQFELKQTTYEWIDR
jgi:hypothetical protein